MQRKDTKDQQNTQKENIFNYLLSSVCSSVKRINAQFCIISGDLFE